jgi:hypothetical protein
MDRLQPYLQIFNNTDKHTGGLYYKPMMIVNDESRVINKLEASLTDDARVIIYDCHMFIVQATGMKLFDIKILSLLVS